MEKPTHSPLSLRRIARCGLFAALTAVCAQISIPLQPVPIQFALLPVLLAGALLGPTDALLSQLAYLLLGAVGVPVFTGFSGGLGVLAGPTGGYLMGYLAACGITGLLAQNAPKLPLWTAMALGVALCYAFGTGWFMFLTGRTITQSLALCVFPFLPGDALKIVVASFLTRRLKPVLSR